MTDSSGATKNRTPLPVSLWIGLAAAAVVIIGLVLWSQSGGGKVEVPDVVGSDQTAATQSLQSVGLALGAVSLEATDAAAGTVLAQDPAGGVKAEKGASVALTISEGPARVEVPELIGLTQSEAEKALSDAGLESTNTVEYDTLVESGSVIDQLPAAGEKVSPGSTVGLLLSIGKRPSTTIKVPNVTRKTQRQAQTTLREAGLAAYIVMANDSRVPSGLVAHQAPAANEKVEPSTMVLITISTGPAPAAAVAVPDVVGSQQAAALTKLEAQGLKARAIEMYSAKPKGQVVEQEPVAGVKVASGSTVGLLVSAGPAPDKPPANPPTYPDPPPGEDDPPLYPDLDTVEVPKAVGRAAEDAIGILLDAGLQPIAIPTPNDTYEEGVVFEQVPDAGEVVYKGYSVMLLVSSGPAESEPAEPDATP
ncbi:MAG: PASTA domain-containing protein [Coriobacteriia bacterium]|nr:PASTA domain-containing protein [Coriobacteriia bacterium]